MLRWSKVIPGRVDGSLRPVHALLSIVFTWFLSDGNGEQDIKVVTTSAVPGLSSESAFLRDSISFVYAP